jgi:hypothetical protein
VIEPVGWYAPVDPPVDLAGLLACSWTAVPTGVHRLTPDGCSDLLRIDDGRFVLCGPEHESWTFELPPGTTAVGVRFRPGAVHAVFGIDVSTIADQRVPLESVIGAERTEAAAAPVVAAADLDGQRRALVDAVHALAVEAGGDPPGAVVELAPEVELVLGALAHSPRATQAELAGATGMSVRTLRRVSLRHFGYGTATLARILRFQRFLAVVSMSTGPRSLAVFAAQAGYVDQAHLARDCKAITSLSTLAFLDEYFPTFPDMADPYKTPGPSWATLAS